MDLLEAIKLSSSNVMRDNAKETLATYDKELKDCTALEIGDLMIDLLGYMAQKFPQEALLFIDMIERQFGSGSQLGNLIILAALAKSQRTSVPSDRIEETT